MFSSASKPKSASNSNDRRRSFGEVQAPPSTPSLREMITKAVADLREAQGSTAKSIYEFVSNKFTATPTKVNNEIQRSVEAGFLIADPAYSGTLNTCNTYIY